MGEDRLKKDEKVNASDEYVKARDAAASIHADEHRRARNELTEAKALIAQMAEALESMPCACEPGGGIQDLEPGFICGNCKVKAAHAEWSAK